VTRAGGDAPFLEPHPPHWAARGLWYALLVTAIAGLVAAVVVRVPETVSARFTLTQTPGAATGTARARGEMLVPESVYTLVDSGQVARLRFDAFPYQRYGVQSATLRSVRLEPGTGAGAGVLRIVFELHEGSIGPVHDGKALLSGMAGEADIVVGHRTLGGFLFGSYIEH
jgi:membrane fusion protein